MQEIIILINDEFEDRAAANACRRLARHANNMTEINDLEVYINTIRGDSEARQIEVIIFKFKLRRTTLLHLMKSSYGASKPIDN